MNRNSGITCLAMTVFLLLAFSSIVSAARTITDATGRRVAIPDRVERIICSGPGALRLLTYLGAQDRAVAVDSIEKRKPRFEARPYALANPQFKTLPLFGDFRGHDHPELILALNPQPQVIFKTYAGMGHDPVELQQKTGIPVVILNYGDLGANRSHFFQALEIMGTVLGKQARANDVISFFKAAIADLKTRTRDIPADLRPACFVGGIAFKGPHGFQATEPGYPPFAFVGVRNLAFDPAMDKTALRHSSIAKEKIMVWNPGTLFMDLSTLQLGDKAGALHELKTDPAYRGLTAVKNGRVYGLLPYNWYTRNFGSILANAYYLGKLLFPERFTDIDPPVKADELYTFLVGKPVFDQMNRAFGDLAFKRIPLEGE
jgi:iron complex transport system substrate-binding protein